MGSYRIRIRRDYAHREFNVVVDDETSRSLAELNAFSSMHAKKVVRDLVSLVRRRDPDGVFTVERRRGQPLA